MKRVFPLVLLDFHQNKRIVQVGSEELYIYSDNIE